MLKRSSLASAVGLAIAGGSLSLEAAAQDATEEVVVTGSRIRQDTFSSSAPMDVVLTDSAALRGIADIGTLLQATTVAAGSPQVTSATSTAFVQNGGSGAQTLSLRGLGANRTLVLLNNRRAGPAGVRGGVSSFDLNVLPLAAIERIEILKDGASSIYGSDAVAGVVNIITKKDDGASVDAYLLQPSENGGEESRLNFSWGTSNRRGRLRVTADYYEQSELAQGDRDYFSCAQQYIFDVDTGDRADVIDPRTDQYRCADLPWGHVWIYDYQDEGGNVPTPRRTFAQYDYDGDLGNYIPGFAVDPGNPDFMVTPPGWFPVSYDRTTDAVTNADHPFQDASSLIPKLERSTIFAEGDFSLTDNMQGYAEVLLNRRKTTVNAYRQYWWLYIYNENSNGVTLENPLNAGWTGAQYFSPTPITNHADEAVEVDYRRVVLGLSGDINPLWNWDVSFQHSSSDGDYHSDQIFDDAIWSQEGLDGSCVGTFTAVRGVPCVDVPMLDPEFLRGNVSPEIREFLFGRETGNTEYTQRSIEGYVAGELAELPAGALGAAFGIQYMEDEIRDVPGEITLAGNVWGSSAAGITAGEDTTSALFTEFQVPLLAGKPLVDRLSLNASYRYTDVDSYGSEDTYKVGLNWEVTPNVRVRANQGTSFRSPALFELYLADQTGFLSQRVVDPCIGWAAELEAGNISQRLADNCAADGIAPDFAGGGTGGATTIAGGGFGRLEAETSEAKTIGVVWQPSFADLSFSVDYFDIEVKNEVDQLGADQITLGCYDSDFFPDEPLCDLFERRAQDSGIDNIRDSFINIATQNNSGFDVSLLYRTDLRWGALTVETQHTFQNEDKKALFADTVIDTNGEIGDPEHVGRLSVTLDRGDWSYFWGANVIGSSSNVESFGGNTATYRGETVRVVLETDQVVYHAFSAARVFESDLTVRFGVSNAFDEKPPRLTTMDLGEVDTVGVSAFYSQYDWLGRRFFLNLTKGFD